MKIRSHLKYLLHLQGFLRLNHQKISNFLFNFFYLLGIELLVKLFYSILKRFFFK